MWKIVFDKFGGTHFCFYKDGNTTTPTVKFTPKGDIWVAKYKGSNETVSWGFKLLTDEVWIDYTHEKSIFSYFSI